MTVLRARYSRIRSLTENILLRCRIIAPPVPVEEIIAAHGIGLRHGDLGEVSGLIARQGRETVIGVNSTQRPVRQRFTMAHELGHFFLHEGLTSHRDTSFRVNYRDRSSSEATDVEEIEANFFAACLLMPKPFLDAADAAAAIGDDDAVYELALRFTVSSHAMSLRLANEYEKFRPF